MNDQQVNQNRPTACGACAGTEMEFVADIPIYTSGEDMPDSIWRCRDCGTYQRAVDFSLVVERGHFDVASYTPLQSEERFYRQRIGFMRHLLDLACRSLAKPLGELAVLDVGCSYGHLLNLASEGGARTTGVEVVDHLRERLPSLGHDAYQTVSAIPGRTRFDAIFAVDSLYLFEEPRAELERWRRLLGPGGVVVVRVTNRTAVLDWLRKRKRRITVQHLGDAKYNFSRSGLIRLMRSAGFDIHAISLAEPGKRHESLKKWLGYKVSWVASTLTARALTPGLTVVAVKTV